MIPKSERPAGKRAALNTQALLSSVAGASVKYDLATNGRPLSEPAALRELPPSVHKVWRVIAAHSGERLTKARISDESGVPRATVTRALARIKQHARALGIAGRFPVYEATGEFRGYRYFLAAHSQEPLNHAGGSLPMEQEPRNHAGGSFLSEPPLGVVLSRGRDVEEDVPPSSTSPNESTPLFSHDEHNVAVVERRLDSLVTSRAGRRDIVVALRNDVVFVEREVARLAQSPTAESRAGVLVSRVRVAGLHVSALDAEGRCRHCGAAVAEARGCARCVGWHEPAFLAGEPLSPAERAEVAVREAERQQSARIERDERRLHAERLERMHAAHGSGTEIRSAHDLAEAARREMALATRGG